METGKVYFAVCVKACGYTPAPQKKATNLLALHATPGAQSGTKFIAATALTTLPDPDASNHSLQCNKLEPDPKHTGAMSRTELAPEWIKSKLVEMERFEKLIFTNLKKSIRAHRASSKLSLKNSWLIIRDSKKLCNDIVPSFKKSSWSRHRVCTFS